MSKEGFKYYLPAFMCSLLRDSSVVAEGLSLVVLRLKLPIEMDTAAVVEKIQRYEVAGTVAQDELSELIKSQFAQANTKVNAFIASASQFTPAQGQAIHHFLIHTRDECGDELLSSQANLAIQRYWFQFA